MPHSSRTRLILIYFTKSLREGGIPSAGRPGRPSGSGAGRGVARAPITRRSWRFSAAYLGDPPEWVRRAELNEAVRRPR